MFHPYLTYFVRCSEGMNSNIFIFLAYALLRESFRIFTGICHNGGDVTMRYGWQVLQKRDKEE